MKRVTVIFFFLVGVIIVTGLGSWSVAIRDQALATNTVKQFGLRLKNVSLLGPSSLASEAIRLNYAGLVTPRLLQEWQQNPSGALGRVTSSPWPEQIQISSMSKDQVGFKVIGDIVETTSVGETVRRPILLQLIKLENRWLISDVVMN